MSIKNIFGAAKTAEEEIFSAGSLLGTEKYPAKDFVPLCGSDPHSLRNDIVRTATLDAFADSLEGDLPKEFYVGIAEEVALRGDLLSKAPTTAAPLSEPQRMNPLQLRARGIHHSR